MNNTVICNVVHALLRRIKLLSFQIYLNGLSDPEGPDNRNFIKVKITETFYGRQTAFKTYYDIFLSISSKMSSKQ